MLGVAREVAALTGAPLKRPESPVPPSTSDATLPVKDLAPDLCGRFSGRVVRNVNAEAPTPEWMVRSPGALRPALVTALVDISNYVMLELGRRSHIFDLDKIHGGSTCAGRERRAAEAAQRQTVEVDRGRAA